MKRNTRSVILTIVLTMMVAMIVIGALCALPAKAGKTEEETMEFDLRDGYLGLESVNTRLWSVLNSFRYGGENSEFFDLDGDGTADLKISTVYTVYYSYRCVLTPVSGGSIHGDFVLKPTKEHPLEYTEWDDNTLKNVTHMVKSVAFHFPAEPVKEEYSLSGTGVKFSHYVLENDKYIEEEVTKAAPGEEIHLLEDKKTGQYLKAWKTDNLPEDDLIEVFGYELVEGKPETGTVVVRRFIMPAHDVTLEPVYEKQKPYTIQIDGPNDYMTGSGEVLLNAVDCFIDSLWHSEFLEDWALDYCDLDGDGTDDIYLGPYKSDNSLNVCLFSNLTSYTLMAPNDGPYWPVTLSWKEEPTFTVDPSAMFYGATSYNNGKLLYRSLQAYEIEGKEGFFDLDQDGSEDLRFDGHSFDYLSTCSVKNSVTIPAVEEGVNHPVTFVVKEIPENSKYYKVTVIPVNTGSVSFSNGDWQPIGTWYKEDDYVTLYPGVGYWFNNININGSDMFLDDYEKQYGYSFDMPAHDVVIRVQFRTISGGQVPITIHDAKAYVIDLTNQVCTIFYEDKAIIKPLMEQLSEYGLTQQDYTIKLSDDADLDSIPEYIMLPEIMEINGQSYDMIQLILPGRTSSNSHKVTVEGGWIDGPSDVPKGAFVRIYADCRTDGLYVSDWMVYGVMGWSYWEGELSFQVEDEDVNVVPEYRKTNPLIIDLSDGEWDYTIDMLNCVCDAINLGPYDRHLYYDLDGDGNMDIMAMTSQMKFVPLKSYSCGASYTLEGGTRGPYYPITFVYNPKNVEPDVTVTPEPTAELTEPTGEQADSSEKKEDSSFHPLYVIIPAGVLLFAGTTALLLMRRKKRVSEGEVQ